MPISVADIMTSDVHTAHEDTLFAEAAKDVAGHSRRHLIVVDNTGRPTGVFSQRDMLRGLAESLNQMQRPGGMTIKELGMKEPITITSDTTLQAAAGILAKNKFGCLPVVAEDGQLEGILSVVDVLNCVAENPDQCADASQ